MGNLPKIYRVLVVAFAVVLVVFLTSSVLMSYAASPAVQRAASYAMIGANAVLFLCVFAFFALRFRPEVREQYRQTRRREGRTVGFYAGSIVALLGITAVVEVILIYLLDGTRYATYAAAAVPLVVGLGYSQWYEGYKRRAAERYDAENDTFT